VSADVECRYDDDEYHRHLKPFAMPNIDNFLRKHISILRARLLKPKKRKPSRFSFFLRDFA